MATLHLRLGDQHCLRGNFFGDGGYLGIAAGKNNALPIDIIDIISINTE